MAFKKNNKNVKENTKQAEKEPEVIVEEVKEKPTEVKQSKEIKKVNKAQALKDFLF